MLSNLLPAKICRTVPFKVAMQVIQDSLEVANCSKCRPVTKSCWVSHCCCCPWYRSLTEVAYFLEVHVKGKWNASDIANSEWQRPHTSLGWVEWCSCSLELYHSNRSANCYRCFRHPQHSSSSIFYLFCKTTRLWKGYGPAHWMLFEVKSIPINLLWFQTIKGCKLPQTTSINLHQPWPLALRPPPSTTPGFPNSVSSWEPANTPATSLWAIWPEVSGVTCDGCLCICI